MEGGEWWIVHRAWWRECGGSWMVDGGWLVVDGQGRRVEGGVVYRLEGALRMVEGEG